MHPIILSLGLMQGLTLGSDVEDLIPMVAVGGGLMIAALGIISGTLKAMHKTKAREESRREVAAYVAEGSMKPEDAERILEAGMPGWEKFRRDRG